MGKSFNDKTYQTYKADKVANKKKVRHSKMEPYKRTKVQLFARVIIHGGNPVKPRVQKYTLYLRTLLNQLIY